MPRDVDLKKTRKALRIIRKLAAQSTAPETIDPETGEIRPGEGAVDYSQWENEFLTAADREAERDRGQGAWQKAQGTDDEKAAGVEASPAA